MKYIIECKVLIADPDISTEKLRYFKEDLGLDVDTDKWARKTFHMKDVICFFERKEGETVVVISGLEFLIDYEYDKLKDLYYEFYANP